MHKPAFGMPGLGPRVREHQEQPVQTGIGQGPQHQTRIIIPQAEHIRQRGGGFLLNRHKLVQQRTQTVMKNFGGYIANFGVCFGLGQHMLASTKADLEPDLLWRMAKNRSWVRCLIQRKPQAWQRFVQQAFLTGAERMPTLAAIHLSGGGFTSTASGWPVMA